MNPLQEKRRSLGHHRPCIGGDSSQNSTSVQTTITNVADNRAVNSTDNHSTNTDSNNSTNMFSGWSGIGGSVNMSNVGNVVSGSYNTTNTSVNMTDQGAVQSAFAATAQGTGLVMALADRLAMGATSVANKNADLTAQLSQDAKSAFSGAASQASGQNTFIFIALTVVALAYIVVKK
jgi:hypothetical protein